MICSKSNHFIFWERIVIPINLYSLFQIKSIIISFLHFAQSICFLHFQTILFFLQLEISFWCERKTIWSFAFLKGFGESEVIPFLFFIKFKSKFFFHNFLFGKKIKAFIDLNQRDFILQRICWFKSVQEESFFQK